MKSNPKQNNVYNTSWEQKFTKGTLGLGESTLSRVDLFIERIA